MATVGKRGPGRMGPYVDGFTAWLHERAYTPGTVQNTLRDMRKLGGWMADANVEPEMLSWEIIDRFRGWRGVGTRRVPTRGKFGPLVEYLKWSGVWNEPPVMSSPVDGVLADYHDWLVARGLAAGTVLRYDKLARRFLERRFSESGDRFLTDLAGAQILSFLLAETARVSVGSAQGRLTELRALLRYLHIRGLTGELLAGAMPPVAAWHDTAVPPVMDAEEVQRIVAACDRDGSVALRDRAMLLLVSRLGLRCIEVARLRLEDIDWRAGEILVRGKGGRQDRLPLPRDLGEALAEYLRRGRPATAIRQVFIVSRAPRRAIRPHLVSQVTRRACERAGVTTVGAHRLRHALATEMLRRGAGLAAVGQVLRHQDLATTAIYAKVDLAALRQVARRWPETAK